MYLVLDDVLRLEDDVCLEFLTSVCYGFDQLLDPLPTSSLVGKLM